MSRVTALGSMLRVGGALSVLCMLAACAGESIPVADNGGPGTKSEENGVNDATAGAFDMAENPPVQAAGGASDMPSDAPASDEDTVDVTFDCGPIKCSSKLQYCMVGYGGIQGDNYSCVELPSGCAAACECAQAPPCGECTDDGGTVVVRCAVG